MAQEGKRGCGYRKVGNMYLAAEGFWRDCDRLPFRLVHCPACGEGVKFARSPKEIDPLGLFKEHGEGCEDSKPRPEPSFVNDTPTGTKLVGGCQMCYPRSEVAYLLGVGEEHYETPQKFMEEAIQMGISKRIKQIPKKLKLGETWVYLCHRKAILTDEVDEETGEKKYDLAVFAAFRPQRIEKCMWKSQVKALTEDEKKDLHRRGISIVEFEDGDPDHIADRDLPKRLCDIPGCGKKAKWFQSPLMNPDEPALCRRHHQQQERAMEKAAQRAT